MTKSKSRQSVNGQSDTNKTSSQQSVNRNRKGSQSSTENPEELYAAALVLVEQSQPAEALEKAQRLLSIVEHRGTAEVLPALTLLGEICVELGDADTARAYFEKAVVIDPDGSVPESMGGGAEKFLWLAQLCEEGGIESVQWYEKGVKALQTEIATLELDGHKMLDEESLLIARMEKKRKLANALCGIVEVYMTDLSWEEDAEARCEILVTEAMTVEDEPSPEVLQTLASVRLSQERRDDARAALGRSLESWKDLEPEDPGVPDFPTRISLARLLMEAEMLSDGFEVLNRLVQEDDESVEAWYLGGWCQYLVAGNKKESLGGENGHAKQSDEQDEIKAIMKGSRHWLRTSIKLYQFLEYQDDRLYDHALELVEDLDMVLGPEDEQAEGAEESSGEEWDGIEDNADADERMDDA